MPKPITVLFIIGLCFFGTAPALAYVPGPEMILSLMTRKIGQTEGFRVKQELSRQIRSCDEVPRNAQVLSETAWYQPPGRFRAESTAGDTHKIVVTAADQWVTVLDREILSTTADPAQHYTIPLRFRQTETLSEQLATLNLDLTVTSLGRHQKRVAFVIGARYPDTSVSQLWVDKTTLLPWRLLLCDATGQITLEIIYEDWFRVDKTFRHPRRIAIYQNNTLQQVICADRLQATGTFAEHFFDPAYLRAKYPEAGQEQADTKDPASSDDVEQTIDDFRKLYQ